MKQKQSQQSLGRYQFRRKKTDFAFKISVLNPPETTVRGGSRIFSREGVAGFQKSFEILSTFFSGRAN